MKRPFSIDACLVRARIALNDGRTDEGIDELRRGLHEAAGFRRPTARKHAENILRFASEHDVYDDVELTLHEERLKRSIFGNE